MAALRHSATAKILYAALFVVLLPVLLVLWARATENIVSAPAVRSPILGATLVLAGFLLVVSGWIALWRHGGGLPMNIAPPPRFVSTYVYALLPHPIYTGFCLMCLGLSLAVGSASGLWLITPCMVVGCASLVLGYERTDLRRRFGRTAPLLPSDSSETPTLRDRLLFYCLVLVPWLALYEAFILLGPPYNPISTFHSFDLRLPVLQWTEAFYASTYLWVVVAPLIARTKKSLRDFSLRGLLSMTIVFPLFLVLPLLAEPRPFSPHSLFGNLLNFERAMDTPAAAFPSYHVIWAMLALPVFEDRAPRSRWIWRAWIVAIVVSCLTTGMHSLADILAGLFVGLICTRPASVWQFLRQTSERVANSWREWHIGPIRVINYTFYAASAAFMVLLLAGTLAGPHTEIILFAVAVVALIVSGLWAQVLEGSSGLLRPFGYFGGFVGAALAGLVAWAFGVNFWLVMAAFAVGAPWMQAIGRLRCLVQGCCHGSPASALVGICYFHERSRVCRVPGLKGVPVHATPLYSIIWNVYLGLLLAHLWLVQASLHFLCGLYCILMGMGRFAEEAYRGEPQTPTIAGLRIYQWIALGVSVLGAMITALGRSGPAPGPQFTPTVLLPAILFSALTGFALGVDFPESNRRFARLA